MASSEHRINTLSNERFAGVNRKDLKDLLFSNKKILVSKDLAFPQALQQTVAERNNIIQILQQYVESVITDKCGNSELTEFKECFNICKEIIDSPISVAIVGRGNSGKSMLLSQLLSEEIILPRIERHCTSRLTLLRYSPTEIFGERYLYAPEIQVTHQPLLDRTEDSLDQKLNRQRDLLNKDVIAATIAEIGLPNELLKSGVELMDFPSITENKMLQNSIFQMIRNVKPSVICYVYNYIDGFSLIDAEAVINLHNFVNKDKAGNMTEFMVVANQVDLILDPEKEGEEDEDEDEDSPYDGRLDSKTKTILKLPDAEQELVRNCEDEKLKNRHKSLNFEIERILPIVPISTARLAFKEGDATDQKYLKMLTIIQNQLLEKISRQSKNYLHILTKAFQGSNEYTNHLWLIIQSLMLKPSLRSILKRKTFHDDYPGTDFSEVYRIRVVTTEDFTLHITSICNNSDGAFDFEEDVQAIDVIVQYKMVWNPSDFQAYISKDDSTVFIIYKFNSPEISFKRVVDCLDELSSNQLLVIMKEIVAMNSVLKLTVAHFRPDTVYFNSCHVSHCFVNQSIPIDLPLVLKNGFIADPPYHFIDDDDIGELLASLLSMDNSTIEATDETIFAEFLYSFGWFVWILVEGTARRRVDREKCGPEQWLEMIPTDRLNQFPDYLSKVMKLCWSVRRNDKTGNAEKWFEICQMFDDDDQLLMAIHYNKPHRIKECIDKGAEINQFLNSIEYTPLCLAADNGFTESVQELLHHGADPNLPNRQGASPLILAVSKGHSDVVRLLLKCNADPNIAMKDEKHTALHVAVHYQHTECVKALMEHNVEIHKQTAATLQQQELNLNRRKLNGCTPLWDAAFLGTVEIMKLLLDQGADPNIKDEYEVSILHAAAQSNSPECIKLIYSHNKDFITKEIESVNEHMKEIQSVDIPDTDPATKIDCSNSVNNFSDKWLQELLKRIGATPDCLDPKECGELVESALQGNTEYLVDFLLKKHFLNSQTKNGVTALMEACLNGHSLCVLQLLAIGADPDIQTPNNGPAALHFAVNHCQPYCLKLLLLHGASWDLVANGLQAIHVAAETGNLECFRILIENKADINAKCSKGITPLMLATAYNRVDLVQMMLKDNADPTLTDNNGNQAIHLASEQGFLNCLQLFIHQGKVDLNAKNELGYAPLQFANKNGKFDCEKLLLEKNADPRLLTRDDSRPASIAKQWSSVNSCNFICPTIRNITKWGREDQLVVAIKKYPNKRISPNILLPTQLTHKF